jgi:NAD(P)H-dependent flavin oxidoreductase YrpB (nitropropane dioxygenase family)
MRMARAINTTQSELGMQSSLCDRLGVDVPIFGFTQSPAAAIAVSRAGGLGVMGTTRRSPEQLDAELSRIATELDGKPFGVDVLFPVTYAGDDECALLAEIPHGHHDFVASLKERFGIPPARHSGEFAPNDGRVITHRRARKRVDVALGSSDGVAGERPGSAAGGRSSGDA